MSCYADLDAIELRAERDEWHRRVCKLAREYRSAHEAGLPVWEAGVGLALDQALAQVDKIDRLLQLGVVA